MRDPRGLAYGTYRPLDANNTGAVVAGDDRRGGYGLSVAQVAEHLGYEWPG